MPTVDYSARNKHTKDSKIPRKYVAGIYVFVCIEEKDSIIVQTKLEFVPYSKMS
jgi:hypothetical protein